MTIQNGKKWLVPSLTPLISIDRAIAEIQAISESSARHWAQTRIWGSGVTVRPLAELYSKRLGIEIPIAPMIPQVRPGDELLVGVVVHPRHITPEIVGKDWRRVAIRWLLVKVR